MLAQIDETLFPTDSDASSDEEKIDEELMEIVFEDLPEGVVHIRCWARSFLLCFSDLAKNCPVVKRAVATTSRIVKLLQCAEIRYDLDRVLEDAGSTATALRQPAETRWNSLVRAMVHIEWMFHEVNVVLAQRKLRIMLDEERTTLKTAIVVMSPIAQGCLQA